MKRKIIKFGQSSHVLSLPSKWVRDNKLKGKDYLNMEILPDQSIRINLESTEAEPQETKIRFTTAEEAMPLIISSYLMGADKITVRAASPFSDKDLVMLRSITDHMTGVDIADEGTHHVEYDCYLKELNRSIMPEIKQMFRTSSLMLVDMLKNLNNWRIVTQVADRDTIVDRLKIFLQRQITLKLRHPIYEQEPALQMAMLTVCKRIERIADQVVEICEMVEDTRAKFSPSSLKLIRDCGALAEDYFSKAFTAFVNRDRKLSLSLYTTSAARRKEIFSRFSELNKLKSVEQTPAARVLFNLIEIIEISGTICEAVVDLITLEKKR